MSAAVPRSALVMLVGCALAACGAERKGGDVAEVTPGTAARIELSADTLELRQGSSASITARVLDADGREVPGATVQFSAAGTAAAAVSAGGVV
jgi:hypothetical protein